MKLLILGANGYVGRLCAAAALGRADVEIVVATRQPGSVPALAREIVEIARGWYGVGDGVRGVTDDVLAGRIGAVVFDDGLFANPAIKDTSHVLNCIGSLDYFNEANLVAVNIELTKWIVDGCRAAGIPNHIYVSTAFAPAVNDAAIEERIYDTEGVDPTIYTRTKREAERIVARSGLHWAILRPSVIIGDSMTGSYYGKRYGLYQLWEGAKRLLPENIGLMRLACPDARMNFLHQDSFLAVIDRLLVAPLYGQVVNVTSDKAASPTVSMLWSTLFDDIGWPETLEWAPTNDALDYRGLPHRIRAFNAFCRTNIEIASRDWTFERGHVDGMISEGMPFPEAQLGTIRVCQGHFLRRYADTNGRVFHV